MNNIQLGNGTVIEHIDELKSFHKEAIVRDLTTANNTELSGRGIFI